MATENKYNMFSDLKTPKDLRSYTLFRGTTDFSQLEQFNLYESGYPYLIVVSIPKFLRAMAEADDEVRLLVENYSHILEYEFKGLESGLENIQAETGEISNGLQSMNVITKVTAQSASTFSMRYTEKAGSILTRVHELYLRSVRDPGTGFKTYNGLIGVEGQKPDHGFLPEETGFDKECFSFLYMHTDNTGLLLERAAYIVGAMPTTAELQIYNGNKGEIQFQEVTCEFSGFPIQGAAINARAQKILDWINSESNNNMVQRNSWNYNYKGIENDDTGLAQSKLTANTTTTSD